MRRVLACCVMFPRWCRLLLRTRRTVRRSTLPRSAVFVIRSPDTVNARDPDGVGLKLTADESREWIVDPVAMTAKAKAPRKPVMPAKYKSLPKEDLDALVSYLASLKK